MRKIQLIPSLKCFPYILAFFLFSSLLTNCEQSSTPKDLTDLEWILGHWKVGEGSNFETWTKVNDQYYFGRNYRIYNPGDTAIIETIDLVVRDNQILYIPTIKTPKGNRQVPFKLISDSEKYFIFENKKNDFPKKISYTKFDNNSVRARTEDEKRKVDYQFTRIK